jgi:ABC-type transporter Mla subunit MlaD
VEVATPYEIGVPRDAIAKIARMGILGETYVAIDTSEATGTPIENHGYLKSKPTESLQDQIRAAQMLVEAAKAAAKEKPGVGGSSAQPAKPAR